MGYQYCKTNTQIYFSNVRGSFLVMPDPCVVISVVSDGSAELFFTSTRKGNKQSLQKNPSHALALSMSRLNTVMNGFLLTQKI